MARYVVDCGVVLHLASEEIEVAEEHELLAPTLLRSQTLSALHEAVHRGELSAETALERLVRISRMQIRLLGDACFAGTPGRSPISWDGPRPTKPSTSR